MTWTLEKLKDIFFSSHNVWGPRGGSEEYVELAEYLNNGWINVTKIPYVSMEIPDSSSQFHPVFEYASIGSGGKDHALLKFNAWWWLLEQGARSPRFEETTSHGIADVTAKDIHAIVECGDTNPEKLFMTFTRNPDVRFVVMPFPQMLGHNMYMFRVSETGKAELKEREYKHMWVNNAASKLGL